VCSSVSFKSFGVFLKKVVDKLCRDVIIVE